MRFILLLALMLFIPGCVSSENYAKFVYKTPETTVQPEYGYLKVYTHSNPGVPYSPDGEEYPVFTPYNIYAKDGQLVKQVRASEFAPAKVKLAKGEYVVVAEMSDEKVISYTVNIEPGMILEVDPAMLENVLSKAE